MDPIVEIQGLSKDYGGFAAVSDLDLSVGAGEVFALLGPNGAGKTTTIRMMMGILEPTAGRAAIHGRDCFRERAEVQRHVGYVPDDPVFYEYLRGDEILRFVGEMNGFSAAEAAARAAPLTARLGLDEDLGEFAVNYSKGMKKKLALACALLKDPDVLILDEPSNGLDPFATRTLHELVRERAEGGAAVFFSTHLLDQAERLCNRVAILHRGRLAAVGPLEELRAKLSPGGSLEDVFFQVAAEHPTAEQPPADPPPAQPPAQPPTAQPPTQEPTDDEEP